MCKGIFRGKRLDNGKWVQGFYCKHDTVKVCFTTDDPKSKHLIITDGFCDWGFEPPLQGVEVDPATVGQYTGLKDCKDKPVFEGDIVRLFSDVKRTFDISDGEVKWCRGAFVVGNGDGFRSSLSVVASYDWVLRGEVIGNIHDNPELLEP